MVRIPQPEWALRPVRVIFPAKISFDTQNLRVREFAADVSVGGIFLPTETMIPVGSRGKVTLRVSQWEHPFTLTGEVVRQVPPDEKTDDQECGLGIRFIDLGAADRKKLERLVDGVCDGSVVQAIRRTVREDSTTLDLELRRRPTDQKVILALGGQGVEINALIREGIPEVLLRLFDNPRVGAGHVLKILASPRTPAKVLIALRRYPRLLAEEEVRFQYCQHPNTVVSDAVTVLSSLPLARLRLLERNGSLRPQIRAAAQSLVRSKTRRFG